MKNVLLALVMSTAALSVAPAALAAPGGNGDFFVEAKVGSASIWNNGTQASSPELMAIILMSRILLKCIESSSGTTASRSSNRPVAGIA